MIAATVLTYISPACALPTSFTVLIVSIILACVSLFNTSVLRLLIVAVINLFSCIFNKALLLEASNLSVAPVKPCSPPLRKASVVSAPL